MVVLLLCGAGALGQQTDVARTQSHRLWKTDLGEFGYQQFPGYSVRWMRLIVDFTDDDHVVIGWMSPDKSNQAKGSIIGVPAHLRVLILDAKTGRKLAQKDWPTPRSAFPVLFGIPDNQIAVCIDNTLRLLSPDLEVVKQQELPNGATCHRLSYRVSPSRRTVLTWSIDEKKTSWELMNVNTLATISTWTRGLGKKPIPEGPIAISDHWLVGWCGQLREQSLCLRRPDEEWRPFPVGGLKIPASFVNDEVLAACLSPNIVSIASVEGTVSFQIILPEKHYFGSIAPAAAGGRFAAIENRLRGVKSEPLDMYPFGSNEQALVYSLKDRRPIFEMKLNGTSPWTPWHTHHNSVALSPNGASLAVLSDGVISIYSVP